jgi:hypothetical protein
MPRIDESLGLDFSSIATTVSDLALPFCADFLRGARVAVVDDIINVGSTVDHVRDVVRASGASEIRSFALHSRDHAPDASVDVVGRRGITDNEYDALRQEAPRVIANLAKPYDLDFPIIACSLASPLATGLDLANACEERFGERAFVISRSRGARPEQTRLTIDLASRGSTIDKVRIYFDESSGIANLVPMRIGTPLPTAATDAEPEGLASFRQAVIDLGSSHPDEELLVASRVAMFVDSLRLGVEVFAQFEGVLRPPAGNIVSVVDTELIFGPSIRRWLPSLTFGSLISGAVASDVSPAKPVGPTTSPAFKRVWEESLLATVNERSASSDPLIHAMTLFDSLAQAVGSHDASAYALDWPYSASDVAADPYLRLKVGFTFGDIVAILRSLPGRRRTAREWRRVASKILDQLIDAGMVVPTMAIYEGRVYRVYRKGEADPRLHAVESVMRGLEFYSKPMSATRLTKIALAASFVVPLGDGAGPGTAPRGNVLKLDGDVLDGEAEVTQFGLRTGRFIRVGGSDIGD